MRAAKRPVSRIKATTTSPTSAPMTKLRRMEMRSSRSGRRRVQSRTLLKIAKMCMKCFRINCAVVVAQTSACRVEIRLDPIRACRGRENHSRNR